MKLKITIDEIKTVNEFDFYWTADDYVALLDELGITDLETKDIAELKEFLALAVSDIDPDEAAKIVLTYKLSDRLNEGQINSLSHEMMEDKVAEEYPDPSYHYDLFNINQLLFHAYGGRFPNTQATIIFMAVHPMPNENRSIDNEVLTKVLAAGLEENNLIMRLFDDQILGKEAYSDASKILWQVKELENNTYQLISSNYWVEAKDFAHLEYETDIHFFQN